MFCVAAGAWLEGAFGADRHPVIAGGDHVLVDHDVLALTDVEPVSVLEAWVVVNLHLANDRLIAFIQMQCIERRIDKSNPIDQYIRTLL
jgi:hypothetical protein